MKRYRVYVTRVVEEVYLVEADNPDDAERKVAFSKPHDQFLTSHDVTEVEQYWPPKED